MTTTAWLITPALLLAATASIEPRHARQPDPQQPAIVTPAAAPAQPVVDPDLDAAVRRFFATQEAEDADAYMALWVAARRPTADQLKYVFDSGDDKFSEVTIVRVAPTADGARVRVTGLRERSFPALAANRPPVRSRFEVSLTYARAADGWKLLREAPAIDDVAASLLEATTPEAREQILAAEGPLVNNRLAYAVSGRGTELAQAQNYAAAQTAFERALDILRRVGDRRGEGEALQNLANAFYYQRNYQRALESYEQRLTIERERQDDEAISSALLGIATIRYTFAEYGVALARYREALAIQEKQPGEAAAATLVSTGNIQYLLGDYPGAIVDHRRSRELYRTLSNTRGEATALSGLGRTLVAQGNLAAGLEAFSGVLAEAKARGDRGAQGAALLNIGDVHFRLGNLAASRTALEESRTHFEAVPDPANTGRVWQALALVDLVGGNFPVAERGYWRSAEACTTAEDGDCVAVAAMGLGFTLAAQDKFAEAAKSYQRAVDMFTARTHVEQAARAEVGLARALTGLGRYDDALAAAGRARSVATGLSLNDVLWRALVAEARTHRKAGAPDRALGAARAAIDPVDEMRALARANPGSPLPRDSSTAFATLALLQADSGDAAGAFDTSERMRVHDLRATLVTNEREIARGQTAEERDAERTAANAVMSLRAQVVRERGLPRPDPARLADLERSLTDAVAVRTAQQARLFGRLPDLALWRGIVDPVRSTDLSALVAPDTLLIDFVVDDERLLVMAAWQEEGGVKIEARVSPLTRRAIADEVAQLLHPTALQDAALWAKIAAPLVAALPDGVLARARSARQVIVVPHDVLWRVPFDALLADGGASRGLSGPLTYLPSVSAAIRAPALASSAATGFLGVAAPVLPPLLVTHLARTAPDWQLRAAESAGRELRLVTPGVARARPAPATAGSQATDEPVLLTGDKATTRAFREQAPQAAILHIAAPFRVSAASALFSPILLAVEPAPPGAPAADAFSTADATVDLRDVITLDLHARVAVLSDGDALSMFDAAAESGLVQWAWRAAGVPAVVLSRWPADTGAREALLRELHKQLQQGKTPGEALRAATQAVRRTAEWAAPFYWAGWMAVGQ